MTDAEIWAMAVKWADTLREVSRDKSGKLESTSLGMTLNCTIRDAIREALEKEAARPVHVLDVISQI